MRELTLDKILNAAKLLDEAAVPDEDRTMFDPGTGAFINMRGQMSWDESGWLPPGAAPTWARGIWA